MLMGYVLMVSGRQHTAAPWDQLPAHDTGTRHNRPAAPPRFQANALPELPAFFFFGTQQGAHAMAGSIAGCLPFASMFDHTVCMIAIQLTNPAVPVPHRPHPGDPGHEYGASERSRLAGHPHLGIRGGLSGLAARLSPTARALATLCAAKEAADDAGPASVAGHRLTLRLLPPLAAAATYWAALGGSH